MKIRQLKTELLLGAASISIVIAIAYTIAASLVINQQHLDQSRTHLINAAQVVSDGMSKNAADLLAAARWVFRRS